MKKKTPNQKKIAKLQARVDELEDENESLRTQVCEFREIAGKLQGTDQAARGVVAMAQYLFRVAGTFDVQCKALLGVKPESNNG
jgi:hypothetical protein